MSLFSTGETQNPDWIQAHRSISLLLNGLGYNPVGNIFSRCAPYSLEVKEHLVQEQEQLRQECVHLQSRLNAVLNECQKEREEKLLLREQLWQTGTELQQQAEFCSGLGSAACSLLWSCSAREDTVSHWLADGKLQAFLAVTAQTLEIFVKSLDEEVKTQVEDHNCQEHQFVLALAGTITKGDWEVCLHSLRLLQSVVLEKEVLLLLGSSLLDPNLQACVSKLTSSMQVSLRLTAQQTLEDLQALQQGWGCKKNSL